MADPILFGPYQPDLSDLNRPFTMNLLNVLPRADGYGPMQGITPLTNAMVGVCRGYFYAYKNDGSVAIFAGTSTRLYQLNNTDFTWTDVSQGGSAYAALSSTAQWQFAQFGNFVIAVQANVAPQVFDLRTDVAFSDLAGSPPQASYVTTVGRFLVLCGLLNDPYRIQWSGLNNVTVWTSGVEYSDSQDFPDGGVVRGVIGGELGIILQDGAIRRMIYSPGSDIIFQIDRIAQDKGLLAPYSTITAGDRMFFLSSQGFVKADASGNLTPIGAHRVDSTFLAELDSSNLQLVLGAASPSTNNVFWTAKTVSGGHAGQFNVIYCYNWLLDKWTRMEVNGEYLAALATPGVTLEGLDAISASIEDLPFSLDDVSSANLPELAVANTDHMIGLFSGSNLEATIEAAEQSDVMRRTLVNGFYPITDASSVMGSVAIRDRLRDTAAYSTEADMNEDGMCPALLDARYVRPKIRIPAGTSWTYASGVVPNVAQGGYH